MRFVFKVIPNWPPLAWLAKCQTANFNIAIFLGSRVETSDDWFSEAVWAGDYGSGGFDQTDIVAGSGARVRAKSIVFVSSGSIHDRLHALHVEDGVWVSNSLCCLLAAADASADLTYLNYQQNFASFRYGLDKYIRDLPTSAGSVQLSYFNNLVWDGRTLRKQSKPGGDLDLSDFSRYREFLASSMQQVAENLSDRRRQHPYTMLCALSNGYDSPTVATLASEAGCLEAMSFDVDRNGRDDSGEGIATILSLQCHRVSRDAWRSTTLPEIPFVACSASVGDVVFKGAEDHLAGKVLLTGMTDTWDKEIKDFISDGAGLGLTEYRLWVGFIHCPVPMWGARQLQDVIAISNSSEMKPWDLDRSYSRPICRRIVEEAGIPRTLFGIGKRGLSVVPPTRRDFLSPSSREDFLGWLAMRRKQSRNGAYTVPSPLMAKLLEGFLAPSTRLTRKLYALTSSVRSLRRMVKAVVDMLSRPRYHYNYVVHWAIDRAKERYLRPP
jgi:hypothetical protein